MQVRVLGDLEVVAGDVVLELGGPKPRTLLALLVAADGRPVSSSSSSTRSGPRTRRRGSRRRCQSYVARLRRALEPDPRARAAPARVLRTHAGGYSLDLAAG